VESRSRRPSQPIATGVPRSNEGFSADRRWPGQARAGPRAGARRTTSFSTFSTRDDARYDAPVPTDPFGLIGQLLDGQYRVDALVGEGGFSAVYRGTHTGLGEPIAIKCLKLASAIVQVSASRPPPGQGPSTPVMNSVVVDSFVKRFRDEGRILYKLSQGNLNVVRCIASGTTTAPATGQLVPYLVLEWLEGRSLEADLDARAGRGRSLAETMELLAPAFDAIAYAHSMGVVHRDLSAGNVFLATTREGGTRAKVLDFGVAKVMTDDLDIGPRTQTLAQIRIYSPAYAAPEQFDSRLGPPGTYTDVYSLALVATEVLAGRGVRSGTTLGEMMQAALDDGAPRTPRALGVPVSDAVEQVFARALSLDASKRQKNAAELWRELRGASAAGRQRMDLGTTARQPSPVGAAESPPTTQRMTPPPNAPHELGGLKTTVRLPSAAPPPPLPAAPPAAPSASQLFQPLAVPPPPGAPIPEASGSYAALKTTERSAIEPPGVRPAQAPVISVAMAIRPAQMPTQPPAARDARAPEPQPASVGSQRAQWLVGLVVFIVVLGVGAVVLRFLLWK